MFCQSSVTKSIPSLLRLVLQLFGLPQPPSEQLRISVNKMAFNLKTILRVFVMSCFLSLIRTLSRYRFTVTEDLQGYMPCQG